MSMSVSQNEFRIQQAQNNDTRESLICLSMSMSVSQNEFRIHQAQNNDERESLVYSSSARLVGLVASVCRRSFRLTRLLKQSVVTRQTRLLKQPAVSSF